MKKHHIATIADRVRLTTEESTKETWHITLDTSECDLTYHPGDSIAIYPENDPILVDRLIKKMGALPTAEVFAKRLDVTMPLFIFLTKYANIHPLKGFPEDLFSKPVQEICDKMRPMLPRFYSVASSQNVHPQRLDLTVALTDWMDGNEKRYGVASHFLCHLATLGETPIPFYVQPAEHFRLPEEHSTDVIMVGPGTGVAPFRAFLQERLHHSASGRHWLFFGERNEDSDFFYRDDWHAMDNLRLHTAFSRDEEEKTYVQHRMREHKRELFDWIRGGAHLYVCGDAKVMAKDVQKTLIGIIVDEEGCSPEEAAAALKDLRRSGRYLLDVY